MASRRAIVLFDGMCKLGTPGYWHRMAFGFTSIGALAVSRTRFPLPVG